MGWCVLVLAALIGCAVSPVFATGPSKGELVQAKSWAIANLETGAPPLSFTYDGQPSAKLLNTWAAVRTTRKLDPNRTERSLTYTDPKTGLVVRLVAVEYSDFPTVEWTAYFENTGSTDTALLENIQALDARFPRRADGEFVLHHWKGTSVKADDFEPLTSTLAPDSKTRLAPPGGRPCGAVFPYFNIGCDGGGMLAVVGWPGQWSAEFDRDGGSDLHIRAGQELTHLKLHPGEKIRTPRIVLQFYRGDWIRSQNIWRRWMLAHNMPKPGGELPKPLLTPCSSHQFAEMINANTANQELFVDRYIQEGMQPDYWWMDAGWYVNSGGWPNTGTWEVDKKRFPNGLREISDHARAKGVKTLVWFEPERVTPGTWLWQEHPDWLLGSGDNRLLNLGNTDAWKWLVEHIDKLIVEQGIDLYRQDYNIDPLPMWRESDTPDRQGIAENHYVTGYLAYWDELRKRHPKMLIDTCASGGHRNDIETLARSVPLLRSDYIQEPIGQQGHTYGLAFWFPYFGTGTDHTDAYDLRSTMCSGFIACWDMRNKDLDYASLRKIVSQWREYAPNFLGDFYPLTPYSIANDQWIAWQFDRPEEGSGMIQAFRRADSAEDSQILKLHGLDAEATYSVKDIDKDAAKQIRGQELMETGLLVNLTKHPSAAVITYERRR